MNRGYDMRCFKSVLIYLLIISMFTTYSPLIFAHEDILDVLYDECNVSIDENGDVISDGEDEVWYFLEIYNKNDYEYHSFHIDSDILTIKYYFSETEDTNTDYNTNTDTNSNSTYTWTTDIEQYYLSKGMTYDNAIEQAKITAEEIKNAYAASMEKWNDIYYYTYDENGNRIANKIITVIEGTEKDHNLTIYPMDYITAGDDLANTSPEGMGEDIPNDIAGLRHMHYSSYKMNVNVNRLFEHDSFETDRYKVSDVSIELSNKLNEFVGQHELGHVLGLFDVDVCCDVLGKIKHHGELLMGYEGFGAEYATYKDIAGVSITRGFHTDEDHVWMMRTRTNGMKDVICALCNGVRYNVDTSLDENGNFLYEGEIQNVYRSCVHYNNPNEEMLLVATDGVREFFKCLYCRHIEEVTVWDETFANQYQGFELSGSFEKEEEKYLKINILSSGTYKLTVNPKYKLNIELYDSQLKNTGLIGEGTLVVNELSLELSEGVYYLKVRNNYYTDVVVEVSLECPPHIHQYTEWTYYSRTHHIRSCECGLNGSETALHVVKAGSAINNRAVCMYCGAIILLGDDFVQVEPMSITKVTLNGSYILPSGIIVLVDEDIEAYENGTLVFYDKDKLPQTQ